MFENVKQYIDEICVRNKKLPYIDVSVYKEHKCLYRYFSGKDENITGKELLVMYSASKPITAMATLCLESEGKLCVEDKVSDYLPEIKNAYLLDDKGNKIKPNTEMKIKHLLTMSAGFDYNFATQPLFDLFERTKEKCTTLEVVNAITKSPLLFNPGEKYEYSLCFDVLGAVIEVASKKRFSEYVKERIFNRIEMRNSTFDNRKVKYGDYYKRV